MKSNRAIIHSCWGGGGNHLRWLLMLDPEFFIFDNGPVSDKVGYILDRVYPATRDRLNWFEFEFKYRQVLNEHIKFAHTNFDPGWQQRPGQFDSKFNYFLYPSKPDIIIKFYRALLETTEWNPKTIDNIKHERLQAINCINQYGGLLVNSEELFFPDLDKLLYDKICSFGNFTNLYEHAKIIHSAWWNSRNRGGRQAANIQPLMCPYVITEIT